MHSATTAAWRPAGGVPFLLASLRSLRYCTPLNWPTFREIDIQPRYLPS